MHATFMVLNIFIVVLAITLVFATGFIVRAALKLSAARRTMACSGRGDSIFFFEISCDLPVWVRSAPLKPSVMFLSFSKV